jgi:hypothetical protein
MDFKRLAEKSDRDFNGYMNWLSLRTILNIIIKHEKTTPEKLMLAVVLENMEMVNDFAHNSHMSVTDMAALLAAVFEE